MTDQPTSLFTSASESGYDTAGSGLGGATTQPLERAKRRELTWNRGTDVGLVLLRFAVGGVIFGHGVQHVFGLWGGVGLSGLNTALTGFGFRTVNILVWVTALTELMGQPVMPSARFGVYGSYVPPPTKAKFDGLITEGPLAGGCAISR